MKVARCRTAIVNQEGQIDVTYEKDATKGFVVTLKLTEIIGIATLLMVIAPLAYQVGLARSQVDENTKLIQKMDINFGELQKNQKQLLDIQSQMATRIGILETMVLRQNQE